MTIKSLFGFLLFIAFLPLVAQAERAPDLVLQGRLTRADLETYRMLPFTVPPEVCRITVEFSYTGQEHHTTVDLGLFDPNRFRGWSGGSRKLFTVAENDATASYLQGPILPGQWEIALGIPNIREDVSAGYTAKIFFDFNGRPHGGTTALNPVQKKEAAWYRGDFHTHSGHSDGICNSRTGKPVPCPVFKTLEAATARKLDFIAVSDHNTVSHFHELRELAPYFDNLALLHAREITTFQGHANVFGIDRFIDFRVSSPSVPDMNAMLRQVEELGGVVSINHPDAPSGEDCMGCAWNPRPQADMRLVTAVEAINGTHSEIDFWETQLNRGYRLTGIGGSDSHKADNRSPAPNTVGTPTTVVYAEKLSESAILDGVRAGHAFIDLEGAPDRMLDFQASVGTKQAHMGDSLQVSKGDEVMLSVHISGVNNGKIEIIEDGKRLDRAAIPGGSFFLTVDDQRHWLRVNVWSSKGKLLLVGNPIYLNF